MKKVRLIASVIEIILGISLIICGFTNLVDEFWSGVGVSLTVVGTLFLLRSIKYQTNQKYREEIDVQTGDERNKYLSLKAWSWAGYLFVMIAAVGTIIFKFLDKKDLMMLCSGGVCVMILLYWISYIILRKKY